MTRPCTEEELKPFKEVAREYLRTVRESVFMRLLSMLLGVEVKDYGSGADYSINDVCREARRIFREERRFDCEELHNAQADAVYFVCTFTDDPRFHNMNISREYVKDSILRNILGDEYEKHEKPIIW